MNAENLVALIVSIVVGVYVLYVLFRPEDL